LIQCSDIVNRHTAYRDNGIFRYATTSLIRNNICVPEKPYDTSCYAENALASHMTEFHTTVYNAIKKIIVLIHFVYYKLNSFILDKSIIHFFVPCRTQTSM